MSEVRKLKDRLQGISYKIAKARPEEIKTLYKEMLDIYIDLFLKTEINDLIDDGAQPNEAIDIVLLASRNIHTRENPEIQ
jgi:hypothetical protein